MLQKACDVLFEFKLILQECNEAQYQGIPSFSEGSIGDHIRHILDHYDCFITGLEDLPVDYHVRERCTQTAIDPQFALKRLERTLVNFQASLKSLDTHGLSVATIDVVLDDGTSIAPSTVERELSFLVSHTVHHAAIVKMIASHFGIELPTDFGVSYSTQRVRNNVVEECVR